MLHVIATEMATRQDMPPRATRPRGNVTGDVLDALECTVRAEAQLVERLEQHLAEHRAMVDDLDSIARAPQALRASRFRRSGAVRGSVRGEHARDLIDDVR